MNACPRLTKFTTFQFKSSSEFARFTNVPICSALQPSLINLTTLQTAFDPGLMMTGWRRSLVNIALGGWAVTAERRATMALWRRPPAPPPRSSAVQIIPHRPDAAATTAPANASFLRAIRWSGLAQFVQVEMDGAHYLRLLPAGCGRHVRSCRARPTSVAAGRNCCLHCYSSGDGTGMG